MAFLSAAEVSVVVCCTALLCLQSSLIVPVFPVSCLLRHQLEMPIDPSTLTKDGPVRPVTWDESKKTFYASVALLVFVVILAIIKFTRKTKSPLCTLLVCTGTGLSNGNE